MESFIPMNDLDRAIKAMRSSVSAMPDLLRALSKGELSFLMKYHPELVDQTMSLQNGQLLPFVMQPDKKGEIALLFSSEERAEEGMKNGKVPPNKFLIGSMPALQVMEILSKCNLRALINKSCSTGEILIGPDMMLDVWNGKALEPQSTNVLVETNWRPVVIDAADYPTYLVQPCFEVLRKHSEFKAAWVLARAETKSKKHKLPVYYLPVLMEPRDDEVYMDFNIVASNACGKKCRIELGLLQEDRREVVADLFRKIKPFFVAAGYVPPR